MVPKIYTKQQHTQLIKTEAKRLGFLACGIAKAEFLEAEASRLETWLNQNRQGAMHYMENHFDKRLDPSLLVEGAQSVISLLYNYYPSQTQTNPEAPKISKYAYGEDYHLVVKDKLRELLEAMREKIGAINGRAFVDSAPVLEKAWAVKSGLGWMGKHTNILTKKVGSFYFLAELIIDIPLIYDPPVTNHCGDCTACIDACPTQAIIAPYQVDGSKCISYFTIELKEEIPTEFKGKFDDWVFGCDICQDVCPWNRFSKPHNEPRFNPNPEMMTFTKKEWEEITEEVFQGIFKKSAVKRTRFKGLQRNLAFIKSPSAD